MTESESLFESDERRKLKRAAEDAEYEADEQRRALFRASAERDGANRRAHELRGERDQVSEELTEVIADLHEELHRETLRVLSLVVDLEAWHQIAADLYSVVPVEMWDNRLSHRIAASLAVLRSGGV